MTDIYNNNNKVNTQISNSNIEGDLNVHNHNSPSSAEVVAADWEKIIKASRAKVASIQSQLGGKLELPRIQELQHIKEGLQDSSNLIILGKSGQGKSVLVKQYIDNQLSETDKLLWIDAFSVDSGNLSQHFHLQSNLLDLLTQSLSESVHIFVDGIDRFFRDNQVELLCQVLSIACQTGGKWKVVISCQQEDYEDVVRRLYQKNFSFGQLVEYNIEPIGQAQLGQIIQAFPPLAGLLKHAHLRAILSNLKYLDLLAFYLTQPLNQDQVTSFSEIDIIDLIWSSTLESGEEVNVDQSTRFLQLFAEQQAEQLSLGIPKVNFQVSDLSPLPVLKRKKLVTEKEDKLFFLHDLFGDWARYKSIRAHNKQLKPYLLSKDLLSPLWCKGVRLYGIYLLEKGKRAEQWMEFFKLLDSRNAQEKIIQDLLLESIVFASDPLVHLENLWQLLKAEKGELLKRFLDRFYTKATYPHQEFMQKMLALNKYTVAEVAVYHRKLSYAYWTDVIHFLHAHIHEIKTIEIAKIAQLAQEWLDKTPFDMPYRKQAAKIAYHLANYVFQAYVNREYVKQGGEKEAYQALLAGVNELPNLVLNLALKLCRRIKVDRKLAEVDESLSYQPVVSLIDLIKTKVRVATQWKDGPYERVDEDFSEVCLDKGGLEPVIVAFPAIAKEILLALLIESPKARYDYHFHRYKLDINEPRRWFPPFYSRGSFLYFLQRQPAEGLDLIIRLVNFATQQWAIAQQYETQEVTTIEIYLPDQVKQFVGDRRVYFWFRDSGQPSHALVSVLMALEKYLIDLIEKNEDISSVVTTLLEQSSSVAFLGVLNSIGKYKKELFLGVLQPLLGTFIFYEWELGLDQGAYNVEGHQMIGSNLMDATTRQLAKEWNEMPQRRQSLFNIALLLNFNHEHIRDFFTQVTNRWQQEMADKEQDGGVQPYLNNIIAQFNLENYIPEKEGDNIYIKYQEPEKLTQKLEPVREHQDLREKFFDFPWVCHKALEEKKAYTLEELEAVWNKVQEASLVDIDPFPQVSSQLQWVFGGCAVLVYHQEVWLKEHPEYLGWIQNLVKTYIEALPYKTDPYEIRQMELDFSTDVFVTRIVAKLWVSDPKSKLYRRLLGLTLCKGSHGTVLNLFKALAALCSWTNPDFLQVQNLLIRWSALMYQHYNYLEVSAWQAPLPTKWWQRVFGFFGGKKVKRDFNLEAHAKKQLREFINGRLEKKLIDWRKLRQDLQRPQRNSWEDDDESSMKAPGIDTQMIWNAYSFLPQPSKTTTNDEYIHLLLFWDQMVEQITFELGNIEGGNKELHLHGDFYTWVFSKLSLMITDIKPEDNPERYWQPLLAYGDQARSWLDYFLDFYFILNINRPEIHDRFFSEWSKMIAFAETQSNWRYFSLWENLLGFSEHLKGFWTFKHKEFWQRAAPNILAWFGERTTYIHTMTELSNLLRTEAGEVLFEEGLGFMHTHLVWQQKPENHQESSEYGNKSFEASLAKTSSYLWDKHRSQVINQPRFFSIFKTMVTYLVAHQNPIGLELQEALVESK